MLGKVGDHAPHGGPIVLPVVDNRLIYRPGDPGRDVHGRVPDDADPQAGRAPRKPRTRRPHEHRRRHGLSRRASPTPTWPPSGWKRPAGKSWGIAIKVETQGAMGIENELSPADIRNADAVVFAVGIAVQKRERFEGKKIIEIPVQDAIKNAGGDPDENQRRTWRLNFPFPSLCRKAFTPGRRASSRNAPTAIRRRSSGTISGPGSRPTPKASCR